MWKSSFDAWGRHCQGASDGWSIGILLTADRRVANNSLEVKGLGMEEVLEDIPPTLEFMTSMGSMPGVQETAETMSQGLYEGTPM